MELSLLTAQCKHFIEQQNNDAAHQLDHIIRVVKTAQQIGEQENADIHVITAAAFCHDVVCYPKNSELRASSSLHAAQKTKDHLIQLGYKETFCQQVYDAISAHSYSAEIDAKTLEAKIVQDADRIDALGAIGVIRCIQVGASLNSQLYQLDDPFCQNRTPIDKKFTIDHFYQKLLSLPDTMNTKTGKKIAQERVAFMKQFLSQLAKEIC